MNKRLLTDIRDLLVEEYLLIGEKPKTPLMKRYEALIRRIDRALKRETTS